MNLIILKLHLSIRIRNIIVVDNATFDQEESSKTIV